MKVTERTRDILAFRREERRMTAQGFTLKRCVETHVGLNYRKKVVDVALCRDGYSVWVKVVDRDGA